MNQSAPGRDTSLDGPITETEAPMPTFNEIIVTKKTDIAWDGGKATENLIPNDGDLVFDSTGGGRSAHEAPLLDELGWATDNNRDTNGGGTPEDDGLTNDSLSVLYAFGEPVTFTATVSPNSPPASPEPVTHAGDFVFDSTGGGSFDLVFPTQTAIIKEVTGLKVEVAVIEFSPDQAVTYAGWGPWEVNTGYPNPSSFQIISAGKDNNRDTTGGGTHEDDGLTNDSLSILIMDAPVASDFFLI
jgi:hypothetical protein